MPSDTSAIKRGLRSLFDGNSNFISNHQIIRTRTSSSKRRVPDWCLQDEFVRSLLLSSFPKLSSDPKQRKQAARWMMVIQLYFKGKKSWKETADEMNEKSSTILSLTRSIVRAAAGNTADRAIARRGSRGRPRGRNNAINRTSCGGANKDL